MPDLEKVIGELEYCRNNQKCIDCEDCQRGGRGMMTCEPLVDDVLILLKEHEAVEPITEHHLFLCPVCKNTLFREQKFCHECGKRIEWEGR